MKKVQKVIREELLNESDVTKISEGIIENFKDQVEDMIHVGSFSDGAIDWLEDDMDIDEDKALEYAETAEQVFLDAIDVKKFAKILEKKIGKL